MAPNQCLFIPCCTHYLNFTMVPQTRRLKAIFIPYELTRNYFTGICCKFFLTRSLKRASGSGERSSIQSASPKNGTCYTWSGYAHPEFCTAPPAAVLTSPDHVEAATP